MANEKKYASLTTLQNFLSNLRNIFAPKTEVAYISIEDNENIEDTSTQIATSDIVDSLDSTSTTRPLSANQGRVLNEKIESTQQRVNTLEEDAQPIEDDEFLSWLNETDIVEPVTDESGAIYTTNNNEIYIL